MKGTIKSVESGEFTVEQTVAVLTDEKGVDHELNMIQRWPVRVPRPYSAKHTPNRPMNSGQRIIDTLFPIAKGRHRRRPRPLRLGQDGCAAPAGQWSDVDIVVYIGCGERGNEMTDVLMEFPELTDPRNGEPLMKRTVLIANTSDMPVAAREASIYTGITIAEYFPRHGLRRGRPGRLHLPLGRGPARDVRPSGGDARRGGLPRLPGQPSGPVLRARGRGRVPRQRRAPRQRHRHRRRLAPGRRHIRAGLPGHHAHSQGVLGAGLLPGLRQALPRHKLAHQLFAVCGHAQALV